MLRRPSILAITYTRLLCVTEKCACATRIDGIIYDNWSLGDEN